MTRLQQIQPFIQACVQAVSAILEAEVTVVDSELYRVAGTGDYEKEVGQRVPHDTFFKNIFQSGKPGIIRDVRKEFTCTNCEKRSVCRELANLAYPILGGNQVIGVIGVIAFKEQEREALLQRKDRLEEFLKYMSVLIESKIIAAEAQKSLERQLNEVLKKEKEASGLARFIGSSEKTREVLALAKKVARGNSTVLISGESGTGKEILAKGIHDLSERKNRLMISINCGAIPESLVESELFGYEEGAFTGASRKGRAGKFELADKSTIFLDEIGDMPLPAQTKLLRVLQECVVERVGGKRSIPVDLRVICATNRDLLSLVAAGQFRADLYYRLNIIPIHIPPLRERREDIPELIEYYLAYYNKKLHRTISNMEEEAKEALFQYEWKGNVRELKNIMEYLFNVVEGQTIRLTDLPEYILLQAKQMGTELSLVALVEEYEKKVLQSLLRECETTEDKNHLADRLSVSRATLYRRLKKYGL